MTRDELTTRILDALNEDPAAPAYWSTGEIHRYLADGQELLAEEAPYVKRTFVVPRRAGSCVYQFSGVGERILTPYRVWLPDLHRRLESKTLADLDARHERWMEVTGEPWWWVPVSLDQFIIWPFPTTGDGTLEINCYAWPAAMLDGGDEPEFHPSLHQALVSYGEALGAMKQWFPQQCLQALQAFLGEAGQVRAQASLNQIQSRVMQRGSRYGR